MREIALFIASLAGAAVLTSLQVLIAPTSPFWKWSLCIGAGVFGACALGLFIDLMLRHARKSQNGKILAERPNPRMLRCEFSENDAECVKTNEVYTEYLLYR
jgi:hypothetical protein